MQVCRSISAMRAALAGFRRDGDGIGLVPTMGALHPGHMALVAAAKAQNRRVAATIFVNPAQFGDPKDLAAYPRTEEADLAMLAAAGVDAVLIPQPDEIYPAGDETTVETVRLANMLHGLVRPGHFRGVTTVVARLFNIVQPDAAYFGEKDYQQLQVIRRMTRDLHFPLRIVGVPTMREADGLAMSSRNTRLTPEDRAAAPVLYRALQAARAETTLDGMDAAIRAEIAAQPRAGLRAVDIAVADTLAPPAGRPDAPITEPVAIMLSATFGEVLLIDQTVVRPNAGARTENVEK